MNHSKAYKNISKSLSSFTVFLLAFLVSALDFPLGQEAFPPVFCTVPGTLGTSEERSVISPQPAAGRKGPMNLVLPRCQSKSWLQRTALAA